ncbi:GTP-binding protein [Thalassospira alkalitolerans]|uniref:flagellar biosynthesis protein FlhF n=1 Tax=Thalassospira alkalitolerans TaxID=1293890 RepID=UPI0030EF715D|tara:strand:- start:11149 stop:12135 length:987 start_codon:yes stop_codon:yes gene_type:complete
MRLKTFTAPTMTEAMALVKEHMGPDAIIVSTQDIPGTGVRLTAALDCDPDLDMASPEEGPAGHQELLEHAEEALLRHNLPERLRLRLFDLMGRESGATSAQQLLATALDEIFDFSPLPEKNTPRALAFVGPPGCGKTLAVAKTAARAVMKKRKVAVLTTDYKRAGGIAQLEAFTRILQINLAQVKTPKEFKACFARVRDADMVLVDTASCNPYVEAEIKALSEFMSVVPCEPILVNPAGLDADECADIANAFADCGVSRMVISRLDVASRLGGALYGADSGNLSLCNVSMTAQVADGLTAISPVALAKLLIPSHRAENAKPSFSEVVK